MDDVQIRRYLHQYNFATESEARSGAYEETDAQGAKYYRCVSALTRESAGSGGDVARQCRYLPVTLDR